MEIKLAFNFTKANTVSDRCFMTMFYEISQGRYAGSHHSLFSSPNPNVEVENYACILKTGDIKFFIMTNMKGPLQIPFKNLPLLNV